MPIASANGNSKVVFLMLAAFILASFVDLKSSYALTISDVSPVIMSANAWNSNSYNSNNGSNQQPKDWGHGGWFEGHSNYSSYFFSVPELLDSDHDGIVSYNLTVLTERIVNSSSHNLANPMLLNDSYFLNWEINIANSEYSGDRRIYDYTSYSFIGSRTFNVNFNTSMTYEILGIMGIAAPIVPLTLIDPTQDAFFLITHQIDSSLLFASAEPIPEPSTIILLGAGILGLIGYRKRWR